MWTPFFSPLVFFDGCFSQRQMCNPTRNTYNIHKELALSPFLENVNTDSPNRVLKCHFIIFPFRFSLLTDIQ